jgi:hypothetical protein
MTIVPGARSAAVLLLVLGLAACAERPAPGSPATGSPATGSPAPGAELPPEAGDLVLRIEHVGGFTMAETQVARLPIVSVYADGRVITEGPVAAIYPGLAWPNVQVVDIGREGVQEVADRALAAGVAETGDLGTPPLADAPSTRFTLVTAEETHVREVYGLTETLGMPASGLTESQVAARQELHRLSTEVTDLAVTGAGEQPPDPWTPAAVAAIVRPWTASQEDVAQGLVPEPLPWPGPELPGEPVGPRPDLSCVVATGEQATAVITAAGDANMLTPWVGGDGARWSVTFRPLLPDESGCADLID